MYKMYSVIKQVIGMYNLGFMFWKIFFKLLVRNIKTYHFFTVWEVRAIVIFFLLFILCFKIFLKGHIEVYVLAKCGGAHL
jgi:hypothetical protein